jgi:lysine biosynthesis protein LysW
MPPRKTAITAACPDCGARIYFAARPELQDEVECEECNAVLEVINNNPIKLQWAFEMDYDDSDDFDYEDDLDDDDFDFDDDDDDDDFSDDD